MQGRSPSTWPTIYSGFASEAIGAVVGVFLHSNLRHLSWGSAIAIGAPSGATAIGIGLFCRDTRSRAVRIAATWSCWHHPSVLISLASPPSPSVGRECVRQLAA